MINILFAAFFFLLTTIISAPHIGHSASLWLGGISLFAGFFALYQGTKK